MEKLKPALSKKNRWYIDKHRYYELKYFCLQYRNWKKAYSELDGSTLRQPTHDIHIKRSSLSDPTVGIAVAKVYYRDMIELVERTAEETDNLLNEYILKGVTEGVSYDYLFTVMEIPCGRETYYDRYRKFFWLLDKNKES